MDKRGQISTEYLIVVGFLVFVVLTVLGTALFYTSQIQDNIKFNQLERAAKKIILSAETTFFDGAPAKTTINVYFPTGITLISISDNNIIFNVESNSGNNIIAYPSSVPIEGSLSTNSGLKRIQITAQTDNVAISDDD